MKTEQEIYDAFRADPASLRSSYLYNHYKRGYVNTMRPPTNQTRQDAAWRAGRDNAKAKAQE